MTKSATNNLFVYATRCLSWVSACAVLSSPSYAAPNPADYTPAGISAGVSGYLSQSLEKQLPLENSNQPLVRPGTSKPTDVPGADKREMFVLKQVRFAGFKKIDYAVLNPIVAPFENKTVSVRDIKQLSDQVVQYYAQQGYVVQVFAPPQEVVDGVLRLDIAQASLGGISFAGTGEDTPLGRSSRDWLRGEDAAAGTVYGQAAPGAPIDLKSLDRALVILNSQQANRTYIAELKPGLDEGQTDVVLSSQTEATFRGAADINNYGVESTGRIQGSAQLAMRDVLGLNESLSLGAIVSQGTAFFKAGYAMPLGSDGLKFSIDINGLNYRTVGNATPANGSSLAESLQFSYPLFASAQGISQIYTGVSNRKFENYTYDTLVSNYSLGAIALGLSGNYFSSLLVPTTDVYNISVLQGTAYGSSSPANYQSTLNSQAQYQSYVPNNYTKFNAYYSKSFATTEMSNFLLTLSGQAASNNLNSAENFYVSGPSGVRAYLPGSIYGSQGGMVNTEYNYQVMRNTSVGAFYDFARVQQYKYANSQIINASTSPNVYNVSGAGVKASYKYKEAIGADVYLARAMDVQNLASLNANGGSPNWVFGFQVKGSF